MKTLVIETSLYETYFKLKGLSFKALGMDAQDFYIGDNGLYTVENYFKNSGDTALIDEKHLLNYVQLIYENVPFQKIKIVGRYPITGEELFNRIEKE